MKKKSLLLTAVATLGLSAATMAQSVPSYVPTNGLVGWWPFNGNANDESGNGNNCNNIIGSFVVDRFNNANSSFYGNGINSGLNISSMNNFPFGNSNRTISIWFKCDLPYPGGNRELFSYGDNTFGTRFGIMLDGFSIGIEYMNGSVLTPFIPNNNWHNLTVTYDGNGSNGIILYLDGVPSTSNISNPISSLNTLNSFIHTIGSLNGIYNFAGDYDDIAIWNRVLTTQEISDLYNAVNCANNTAITPQTNSLTTGSTATFTANTSDSNPSFVWQSDFGQGYVNLNNYGNYSGTNTGTLNIANVQLPNHAQPIRVITTSGNCVDTSNVAIISIADTCINTITDTTLITVTDTLIINTTITGLNPPNNANTIKVFPNPTNDHITINYGNFSVMNGYQLKIENSLGQQVFQTNITQQSDYLNLTTWGGNGLYFVHIIDPQGNTIDIRKIVLQ